MACEYTWLINGIDISRLGIVLRTTDWRSNLSVVRSTVTIPNVHGAYDTSAHSIFGESTISMEMAYAENMHAGGLALEEMDATLQAIFSTPQPVLTRIMGERRQQAEARLSTPLTATEWTNGKASKWKATFAIPGAFFHDEEYTPYALRAGSGAEDHIRVLDDSNAPIVDSVIRLANSTAIEITDVKSGTGIKWSVDTQPTAKFVFIDPQNLKAWTSNRFHDWFGEDAIDDLSNRLDYPQQGVLELWPSINPDTVRRQYAVRVTLTHGVVKNYSFSEFAKWFADNNPIIDFNDYNAFSEAITISDLNMVDLWGSELSHHVPPVLPLEPIPTGDTGSVWYSTFYTRKAWL